MSAEITHDPTFGDPTARQVRAALDAGDHTPLRALLAENDDPDLRSFYVNQAVDRPGRPGWLDAWANAEPTSADAHLVRGAHGVVWAWEARGGGGSEQTSREQFEEFWRRLAMAEQDLFRAAELAPGDPEPWAHLVTSNRGRQLGHGELARRFKEVITRHPWHRRAHSQMVQGLAPKWSGSRDLMLNFARERTLAAPAGSAIASTIAEAHVELWLATETQAEEDAYFEQPDVLGEVRAAADRSVRSPLWNPPLDGLRAHNLFAFCFAWADDFRAAADQFDVIADRPSNEPWHYTAAGVADGFRHHRDRVREHLPA